MLCVICNSAPPAGAAPLMATRRGCAAQEEKRSPTRITARNPNVRSFTVTIPAVCETKAIKACTARTCRIIRHLGSRNQIDAIGFDLFDLKIGINGFEPSVARTDCHSRHVTMSIFRLLQVGLPLSGMVGTSVANTGRPANDERNLGLAVAGRLWFDAINCDRRGINAIVVLDNWRFH